MVKFCTMSAGVPGAADPSRFDPERVSQGAIEAAMDEEGYPVAKIDA